MGALGYLKAGWSEVVFQMRVRAGLLERSSSEGTYEMEISVHILAKGLVVKLEPIALTTIMTYCAVDGRLSRVRWPNQHDSRAFG